MTLLEAQQKLLRIAAYLHVSSGVLDPSRTISASKLFYYMACPNRYLWDDYSNWDAYKIVMRLHRDLRKEALARHTRHVLRPSV